MSTTNARATESEAAASQFLLLGNSAVKQLKLRPTRQRRGTHKECRLVKLPAIARDAEIRMRSRFRSSFAHPVYMKLNHGQLPDNPRTGIASIWRTRFKWPTTVSRDNVALALSLLLDRPDAAGLGSIWSAGSARDRRLERVWIRSSRRARWISVIVASRGYA
ncbi:hypothetical protein C8F01DRAFT_463541 [Mycena amicta]|nr:hypothetical protein C8F01DRAFT_463541 [Mycena amicta]